MSIDSARELLADLGKRIAEEEAAVRERVDRISGYDYPHAKEAIRDEWEQFNLRIAPMHREREHVIKLIVDAEACKPPAPMVIPLPRS